MLDALSGDAGQPRGRRWYAVQSQPHKEVRAGMNLENQGFRSFLPRLKTTRHARRTRTVLAPLIPRYLFVSLDLGQDRWRAVYGTFGVSQLATSGTWPTPVPPGLFEELVAAAERCGTVDRRDALTPGDRICFLTGPFASAPSGRSLPGPRPWHPSPTARATLKREAWQPPTRLTPRR